MDSYMFKYEKGVIIACSLKSDMAEPFNFSQPTTKITKEYIEGTGTSPENIQNYIAYVDDAKQKFQNLIDFNGNELNISAEFLKTYRDKIHEWDNFKDSLPSLNPAIAKSQIDAKYQWYHDYFENLYVAMLLELSTFASDITSSNDLDKISYAEMMKLIVIKDKKISGPINLLSEDQRKEYYSIIQTEKVDGKSIEELTKSPEEKDQAKAIRATKQIVKSILEAEMLDIDDKGNIKNIYHGQSKFVDRAEVFTELLKWSRERMKVNLPAWWYFDESANKITANNIDYEKVGIRSVNKEKETTINKANEVQKEIENMQSTDKIWLGRWNVIFDLETNLLTSRGKSIEIDSTTLKIKGLNMPCKNLEELLYTANFINRIRGYYLIAHPTYKGKFEFGRTGKLYADVGFDTIYHYDPTVLTAETITTKYPSLLNTVNKELFKKFINAIS